MEIKCLEMSLPGIIELIKTSSQVRLHFIICLGNLTSSSFLSTYRYWIISFLLEKVLDLGLFLQNLSSTLNMVHIHIDASTTHSQAFHKAG